jgi:hypothetical protein
VRHTLHKHTQAQSAFKASALSLESSNCPLVSTETYIPELFEERSMADE